VIVLVRKGSYTTLNIVKDTENLGKERENPINLVNDLKRSSEILAVKIEIFSEKVIQKSWSANKFSVPPNSAPGLRHGLTIICWCRRAPTLLCSLNILNLLDNFVKKLVSEIRKCRQLHRDKVPLSGLWPPDHYDAGADVLSRSI